jgi:hypothetical protein
VQRSSLVKPLVAALVIAFILAIVSGGYQLRASDKIAVKVIVTQDFGSELMLNESVIVDEGSNAMDALQKVATVETQYGGGFVKAINNVANEAHKDWFFYVNGMSANMGALDYELHNGDIEHWDFHDWSFHQFVPAIIGDFPQPFLGGYQGTILPTIVVYDEGFEDAAQNLVSKLEELRIEDICVQAATGLSTEDKRYCNLVLLGTEDFDLISELNADYSKLGFYIHFEGGKVAVFDSCGSKTQYDSCGVIQATQNPWNPKGLGACENVVWVVSGIDRGQVLDAVDTLINHYEDVPYAYAGVIINGQISKVPVHIHVSKWPSWIGMGIVVALLIILIIFLIWRRKRLRASETR